MSDEVEAGVTQDVADPTLSQQEQPQETPLEAIAAATSEPAKTDKDENIRRMRESLEELSRQNRELQQAVHQMRSPAQPQEPLERDELADLSEDDFINVGQVKKYASRLVKDTVRQVMKEQKGASLEDRFRMTHNDYDEVVNKENLETLFQDMPELKGVLSKAYEASLKGEDVDPVSLSYKLIKKFCTNIGETPMNKKAPELAKLAKNTAKPISSNAIKSSALSEAHKYIDRPSKEEADRIYKETVEASRARR